MCACVRVYTVYTPSTRLWIIMPLPYGTQNYSLNIQVDGHHISLFISVLATWPVFAQDGIEYFLYDKA